MTLNIRRVVTGHNNEGRARITSDKIMENVVRLRSGNSGALMWVTDETPADLDGAEDPAERAMDIEPPARGSVFRILELAPGKKPFMHRTDTIDYALVLSGECVMLLDDGEEVALGAGDILIQRATIHGWANRSDEPCRLAFVLIGAKRPRELANRKEQQERELD
jgi:quercetin dioxygenase-like cupin family protein